MKIFIALPLSWEYISRAAFLSFLKIYGQTPDIQMFVSRYGAIHHMRNDLVNLFLSKPEFTHLLYLDGDMTFPPDVVTRLLKHDKNIVCGLYISKSPPPHTMALKKEKNTYVAFVPPMNSLTEIDASGAGCLLIKREVLERMSHPYFAYEDIRKGIRTSEEIYFFERARDLGYKIWIDSTFCCGHIKTQEVKMEVKNESKIILPKGRA